MLDSSCNTESVKVLKKSEKLTMTIMMVLKTIYIGFSKSCPWRCQWQGQCRQHLYWLLLWCWLCWCPMTMTFVLLTVIMMMTIVAICLLVKEVPPQPQLLIKQLLSLLATEISSPPLDQFFRRPNPAFFVSTNLNFASIVLSTHLILVLF